MVRDAPELWIRSLAHCEAGGANHIASELDHIREMFRAIRAKD